MTTIALPRPHNALLDRLRMIKIGVAARGAVGTGLATQRGGAVASNGLKTSLIGFWAMNEAAGANNALDLHANGLTLTQTGSPGSDAGIVYAGARTFDNSDDWFARESEALLVTGDIDFTVAAWCYITTKSNYNHIASKWQEEWLLRYQGGATDRLYFEVKYGASGYANATASNFGSPPLNTWMLVNAWHDSENNQLAIQVNNGTPNTTAHSGGVATSAGAFNIGSQYVGSLKFAGRIGPVAFWKRVLSADQRTALWNEGAGLAYAEFTV